MSYLYPDPPTTTPSTPVDLKPLTDRLTKAETDIKAIAPYDDAPIKASLKALQDAASGYALAKDLTDEIARRNKLKDVRRSPNLPDFTLDWEIWIQVVEDLAASTIEVVEFTRTGKAAAMPMVQRKLTLVPSAHANAIALPNGAFENGLPRGVAINYTPKIDNQNTGAFSLTFTVGTLTSYQYEGLDASDTSPDVGSGNFRVGDTTLAIAPFYGNANVVKTKWTFTYSDGQTVSYIVPVQR